MKIFLVLLICLGIRLIGLNQSLWLDEAISVNVVKNYKYREIVNTFSVNDFHPPLYYLMLKGWTSVFGYSEVSVRAPSVIFSLVTVYVVYLLAGPAAAGLAGFNPLLVYYSQEARMYAMVTMLLTLAVYFLIKKKYWWYGIAAGMSLATFYGSVFLLATVAIYLIIKRRRREVVAANFAVVIVLLLLWPLLKEQLTNSKEMLSQVKNWSLVLGKANLKNLLLIPMKFTSGRISFQPKFVYYLISGLWATYIFRKMIKVGFYGFLFWGTLVIGVGFSVFTPMLQYFRFLYLIPLMALTINKSKTVTIGFLIFSLVYILNPNFYREDWKGLAVSLGDKVYMIDSFGDPVKYYKTDMVINDIRKTVNEKAITVIPYGEEIHGVDHKNILEGQGYKLISEENFRGVSKENWQIEY